MSPEVERIIDAALSEDIGHGDVTTSILIPHDIAAKGIITAEDDIVLAGLAIADEVFKRLDADALFQG
ncbi:MAG: nicotinate-nucleotide diphosphorylase (carboxylating), partial [Nitrospirota bacterium]